MNEKTAYMHRYASPLGDMLIAASGESVTGLWFYGARHFAAGLEENAREGCPQVIRDTVRWLDIYFSGAQPDFMPPVELHGTEFCRAVWAELMKIPRGETRSYGDVAKRLGVNSAQAVGAAVGRNPVCIIVPCHRVVGANRSLVGYAAGLYKKERLLALEGGIKNV